MAETLILCEWLKDESGQIDEMAWDGDAHGGVICARCQDYVCIWCEPDYISNVCDNQDEYLF